jgi:stage II sporulation protein D
VVADYDNTGVTCAANQRLPLRARYAGALQVVRAADGTLSLVNALTFEQYLDGLAEVPRSWPIEALKAQVIAARTYALSHMNGDAEIGYDLCSTDACQVYRGLEVSEGAFGDTWRQAVRTTAGQVLLYDGAPAETFYFSTSWGRTVSNVDGFGGGTPLPYLQPTSGEDDAAPLAYWHVEMPLTDIGPILHAAGVWSGGAITSASVNGSSVAVAGPGAHATLPLTRFRNAVNAQADCLFPSRYPPARPGGGTLPQTIPSAHLSAAVRSGRVVIDGRGWGHGVGMSQYGAMFMAASGATASDILAHFYGGLRPSAYREPGSLRVLVASDSVRMTIQASGSFTARGPNGPLQLGGSFQVAGGRTMTLTRAGSIVPVLTLGALTPAAQHVARGGVATVHYTLPAAARVTPLVLRDGAVVTYGGEVSQMAGPNQASVLLVDGRGAALAPGAYEVAVEATDGIDQIRTDPVAVQVDAPIVRPALARPKRTPNAWPYVAGGALAALIAAAGLVLPGALRRRRGERLSRT